jgi:hypothetical protein
MSNRKRSASFMNFREAWHAYRYVLRIQRLHQTTMTIGN